MSSNGKLAAKCAAIAAVATGLLMLSQFSERRSVPSWTTATAVETAAKPAPRAATTEVAARPDPAPAAPAGDADACAGATWPNIPPACITGRAEPARRDARPAERPTPALQAVAPANAASAADGPMPVAAPVALDPQTTGSLPAVAAVPAAPDVAAAPSPALRHEPRRAARRAPRRGAPAYAETPASARLREPIQFRLADRN